MVCPLVYTGGRTTSSEAWTGFHLQGALAGDGPTAAEPAPGAPATGSSRWRTSSTATSTSAAVPQRRRLGIDARARDAAARGSVVPQSNSRPDGDGLQVPWTRIDPLVRVGLMPERALGFTTVALALSEDSVTSTSLAADLAGAAAPSGARDRG